MNAKVKFFGLVFLIAVFAYVVAFGVNFGSYQIVPVQKLVKLGLDLRGGASVLLEAKDNPKDPVTSEKMDRAVATIRERIDSLGVTEPTITKSGARRIVVELPEIKDSQKAMEIIGKTAQLQFIEEETKNVILTGEDIKKAQAVYAGGSSGMTQEAVVSLELNPAGTKKFADATAKNVGKVIGIYLDGKAISQPVVESVISDGKAQISGMKDMTEAGDLATLIRAGALPVELTTLQSTSVGPQLGANSFERTLFAGGIGVIIVFIFMMAYYRLPGVIANIALILYTSLVCLLLALIHATLTLPGIAGIILSIGMAVDANILIFERMKEELRAGRTLRSAMDAGFRRAFVTILDSNLTTVIAAVVLFIFGTGTIKGFAVTLTIGVLVSMFTAITVTRFLMKNFIDTKMVTNTKWFSA